MHYYSFHISDFALHTSHLTLEEEAIYRKLLDHYYDTEQPIPKETHQVIRRLRLVNYKDLVDSVLNEFFILQHDGWHNLRADYEINSYHQRGETSRINGKLGGRPKKNNPAITSEVILANPDITQTKGNQEPVTNNHEPITSNHKPITSNQKTKEDRSQQLADFDLLWSSFDSAYGDKGSKKNALSQWIKINPDNELFGLIMDGLYKQQSEKQMKQSNGEFYAPFQHVERWLKNRRWEDEISIVNFSRAKPTREQRIEQALNEAFGTTDSGSIEGDFETVVGNGFDKLKLGSWNG